MSIVLAHDYPGIPGRIKLLRGLKRGFAKVIVFISAFIGLLSLGVFLIGVSSLANPVILDKTELAEGQQLPEMWGDYKKEDVQFTVGALIMLLASIGFHLFGKKMGRDVRELVLYLRKFGFTSSTQMITRSLTVGLGKRWRILTLDDSKTAPLGVSRSKKFRYIIGEYLPIILIPLVIIIGIQITEQTATQKGTEQGEKIMKNHRQQMEANPDATFGNKVGAGIMAGIGSFFATIFVTFFYIMGGVLLLILISITLGSFYFAHIGSFWSILKAEKVKSVSIQVEEEIDKKVAIVKQRTRSKFSARLVIAHVSSTIWKQVVRRFDDVTNYVLIDVSNPTKHLIWEITQMQNNFRNHIVYIVMENHAEYLKVDNITEEQQGVKDLLSECTILVYDESKAAMKSFRRAMQNMLESYQLDLQRKLKTQPSLKAEDIR